MVLPLAVESRSPKEVYAELRRNVNVTVRTSSLPRSLSEIPKLLRTGLTHYHWVGIYLKQGNYLQLTSFSGPEPSRMRIKVGEGICGWAAVARETVLVSDVRRDPRYGRCFPQTKSEIVVPVVRGVEVLGVINVASDYLNAFSEEDSRLLESIAADLSTVL